MSPIQGFVRFRKHQVGKQSGFASNTTATRVLPYRGAIVIDPARTDPDVDVGSLDPILAPFSGASTYTGSWAGPYAYNDAPYLWAGAIKGGVTPTGATAKTWVFQAASLTADDYEYFTDEWGDDVGTDSIIAGSGIVDSLDVGFGDDLSAFDVNANTIYARAAFGGGFTGGLVVDDSPTWVYGADTEVYLDSVYTSIGTTKLTDAIHGARVRVTGNNDQKRFANGSNTRFQLAGYGRAGRELEVEIVVAKTTATVTEAATLDDSPVPNRYIELRTTSPEIITGSTPYSHVVRVPCRLMSRSDGEIGGNSTITLTYRGFYDADLGYAIRAVVVNTLAAL